ncbi:MAG: pyruvate formate lyase-activating protein [Ruminococcaceae bacterium]|nr:pyruvate formate lyase-activating protein [Oscillospiraceae bacterium]
MGRVHSIQSLGTVDGPGVRFVVFLQGCPLRCSCCHNPDTWENGGDELSAKEIVEKAEHYREYFGSEGGITLSGGEPLLQAEFVRDIFALCKEKGIKTCLDTSGCVLNESVKEALEVTDMVLLDIKYTTDELYKKYVGCSLNAPLEFLEYLNKKKIATTLRQVVIPTINNNEQNISKLKQIASAHPCVLKTELLPFRKICSVKYQNLGLKFPFEEIPEPNDEDIKRLNELLAQ